MDLRSLILWICLIAFVGSAGLIGNAIYPNNTGVVVGAIVLSASLCLFIAMIAELISSSIVSAVKGKNMEDQTSVLTAVIGRTLYEILAEKKKTEPDEKQ
jgi:hypothetical protein